MFVRVKATFYGGSQLGVRPVHYSREETYDVGIYSDNPGRFWMLTNLETCNGNIPYDFDIRKKGYKYSYVYDTPFLIGHYYGAGFHFPIRPNKKLTQVSLVAFEEIQYDTTKEYGLIVSNKLANNLFFDPIICKKGDMRGEFALDVDMIHWGNGKPTRINLPYVPKTPNCFDIRRGEISYFNGIQETNEEGKWSRDGRQVMRASKFITMLSKFFVGNPDFYGRGVELLAEKLKSNGVFNIQVSDDPGSIYKKSTSSTKSTGSLRQSCMNAESNHDGKDYVDVYKDFGAKIAYILDDDGGLVSRALLWDNVFNDHSDAEEKTFKFMDRIYGSETHIAAMIEWADENGYYHKVEQSYSNCTLTFNDKQITKFHINHEVDLYEYGGCPYVDTLEYYTKTDLNSWKGGIGLQNTEGGDFSNNCTCYSCGIRVDGEIMVGDEAYCSDCAVFSDRYNRYIVADNAVHVPHYGWIEEDDDDFVIIDNEYHHVDNTFECAHCHEQNLMDNVVDVEGDNWCESCFNSDAFTCAECGDNFENTQSHETAHGNYCDACNEEREEKLIAEATQPELPFADSTNEIIF